jgi:hypothetical protein
MKGNVDWSEESIKSEVIAFAPQFFYHFPDKFYNYGESKKDKTGYPFIPNNTNHFLTQLLGLKKYICIKNNGYHPENGYIPMLKFLDCGCGIGFTVLLAGIAGFDSHGIELNSKLIKVANVLNYPQKTIKRANVLTYAEYSEYDIIYFYCPLRNRKLEEKFEEKVEKDMKVGAYLIANLKASMKIIKDSRFKLIHGNLNGYRDWIFKKVKKCPL